MHTSDAVFHLYLLLETIVCLAIAKELVYHKIGEAAKDFGVSETVLTYVVNNEALKDREGNFLPCGDGDKNYVCPDTGLIAPSRGIVQINDCYHKVPRAAAYNASFAIDFLAQNLRDGKCSWWTTCRNLRAKNPLLIFD